MAKISETKGRKDNKSGYTRLLGHQKLGSLLSRTHATTIRNGTDLEHRIQNLTKDEIKTTIDELFDPQKSMIKPKLQVIFQPQMPKSEDQKTSIKADILILDHDQKKAFVIEVKDGDTFDTKKSSGEFASMTRFAEWVFDKTGYYTTYKFCSFNQDDKNAIVKGAKGRFSIEHAMTGNELCELLDINYKKFLEDRKTFQKENLIYFLSELTADDEIRSMIIKLLRESENGKKTIF